MPASRNNLVNYAVEGGVAVLTLNDPPGNAATHEMMKELDEAIIEARFDSDVHALVITGAGERVFSCGTNLEVLRQVDETFAYYYYLHTHETLQRLENTPKLVVAAINGQCLDGGFELALACDLIVAGPRALFALPEVSVGVIPGGGGTQLMTRRIGWSRAADLIFTARRIGGEEALRLGLVDRFVDDAKGESLALASTIAEHSPVGVRNAKAAMRGGIEVGLDEGLDIEDARWHDTAFSPDRVEGVRAFAEKRRPVWPGLG